MANLLFPKYYMSTLFGIWVIPNVEYYGKVAPNSDRLVYNKYHELVRYIKHKAYLDVRQVKANFAIIEQLSIPWKIT